VIFHARISAARFSLPASRAADGFLLLQIRHAEPSFLRLSRQALITAAIFAATIAVSRFHTLHFAITSQAFSIATTFIAHITPPIDAAMPLKISEPPHTVPRSSLLSIRPCSAVSVQSAYVEQSARSIWPAIQRQPPTPATAAAAITLTAERRDATLPQPPPRFHCRQPRLPPYAVAAAAFRHTRLIDYCIDAIADALSFSSFRR